MRTLPALLLLLLAMVASAQSGPTPSPQPNVVTSTMSPDAGALYWYVDPLGKDTNSCRAPYTDGGANGPCLTIQAVGRKVPLVLRHPVDVSLANGNYGGAWIGQRLWAPTDSVSGAWLALHGNLITTTPTTGTATGTATSATACSIGPPLVDASLADTAATWTVNDFRAFILETTGGTGSGQFMPIASNTATSITLAGCWGVTPNATTTYAIRTWGAVINSTVNQPPNYVSAAGNAIGLGAFGMQDNLRNNNSAFLFLDQVRINVGTTSYALQIVNSSVYVRRSRIDNSTAGGSGVVVDGNSRLNFQNSIATSTTGAAFVQVSLEGTQSLRSLNSLFMATTGLAMQWSGPGVAITNSTSLTTGAAARNILVSASSTGSNNQGLRVVCLAGGGTTGFFVPGASNSNPSIPSGPANILFDSGAFRECATSIQISGASTTFTLDDSTFQATAGTTAIDVSKNASVNLDANSAISGSFTQNILLDGVPVTFATVASTPNALSAATRSSVIAIP